MNAKNITILRELLTYATGQTTLVDQVVHLTTSGSVRLLSAPFMPLVLELVPVWDYAPEVPHRVTLSLCHYGEQNGDAMRDPEMVLALDAPAGEPVTCVTATYFRNDYLNVETYGFRHVHGDWVPRQAILTSHSNFLSTWLHNLRAQGFTSTATIAA